MRWPLVSFGAARAQEKGTTSAEQASAAEKKVDAALRRWRTSIVPVEDPLAVGDRRAKTLSTIGAAMRQAQLERQRSHQHRRWRYALSAAALLLGLGGAVYAGAGYYSSSTAVETQATLTGQSGPVWVGAGSSNQLLRGAPLGAGATHVLSVGDRVVTRAGGEADLDVGADTQVQLHQQSELLLAQNDRLQKRLALEEGVIDVRVEPPPSVSAAPKRLVVVETPDATVVVHGTVFSVGVDRESGHSVTTVSVRRGVVAVLQNGVERRRLGAGERWSSRPTEAVHVSTPPASTPVSAPDAPADAAPADARARASSKPRANAPVVAKPKAAGEAASLGALVGASSTLDAENALFRQAIDARNDGDDAGAVRYFDQLLTTYPKSALAQEAKVERFRALKRMGRGRDAAREARRYLIEHGNGFAEDEARDVALTPGP